MEKLHRSNTPPAPAPPSTPSSSPTKDCMLTWKDLCAIALDVSAGLHHLHKQGVIHRDLAARNVLVHRVDNVYHGLLCDFGLSRSIDSSSAQSEGEYSERDLVPLETLPPEGLLKGVFSRKTDVFGFGIFLFELFTGRDVYPGVHLSDVASQVANDRLRPRIPGFVPSSLAKLMQDCWSHDERARPPMSENNATLRSLISFDSRLEARVVECIRAHHNQPDAEYIECSSDVILSERNHKRYQLYTFRP